MSTTPANLPISGYNTAVRDTRVVEFDLKDKKGRRLGFEAKISRYIVEESTSDYYDANLKAKGAAVGDINVTVWTRCARDGKGYGATGEVLDVLNPTDAEVEAWITNRVEVARKRYSKLFG